MWSCYWKRFLCSIFCFRISIFHPVPLTVQREGSYYLLKRTKNNQTILGQKPAAVKASTNYKDWYSTLQSLKKKKKKFFFHHIYQEHFQIRRNIFVSDGDIKKITHKFWRECAVSGTGFVCSLVFVKNWSTQSYPAIFACLRMASLIS